MLTDPELKNFLQASEVCSIIKVSAKFGVSVLKFRDLEIQFGQKNQIEDVLPDPLPKSDTNISDAQHDKNNEEALRQSELDLRETQIEDLFLENPREAEELLMNGELEDADGESE